MDILITNALPYANGPLHVGHLIGYLQADIWKRFKTLQGYKCIHICGADCHGAPIMLAAKSHNMDPGIFTKKIYQQHIADLALFGIDFDSYLPTNRPQHHKFVQNYYQDLVSSGFIYPKKIQRAFDQSQRMFIADRMILGTCPYCRSEDQYGDACSVCGKHYSPIDMINPRASLTHEPVTFKESKDLFFNLQRLKDILFKDLTYLRTEQRNMINSWQSELLDWSISRDIPYYGIEIPNIKPKKYFYVWFDAFLSYLSVTEELSLTVDPWSQDSVAEIHMYLGKDIVHLHAIHFISMLLANNKRLPNSMHVNGFITLNKQKMSKSKESLTIKDYLNSAHPDCMRLFVAANSHNTSDDISFNTQITIDNFNNLIINKIINIASRVDPLIAQHDYMLSTQYKHIDINAIQSTIKDLQAKILDSYDRQDFANVVKNIETISILTNRFLNDHQPWCKTNQPDLQQEICSIALNLLATILGLLKPISPQIAYWGEKHFRILCLWNKLFGSWLYGSQISKFEPILFQLVNHQTSRST